MALDTITITVDSTDYDFVPAQVDGNEVIRLDTEHGSAALPFSLTFANQPGSAVKADRNMARVTITKRDAVTGAEASVSAHVVFTVPRSGAVDGDDALLAWKLLRTHLTDTVAASVISGALQ